MLWTTADSRWWFTDPRYLQGVRMCRCGPPASTITRVIFGLLRLRRRPAA
ncbi:hypothetical protein H0K98_002394 [Salmonella enterica]|nr:hypothetical protein [Salmonella enterica]